MKIILIILATLTLTTSCNDKQYVVITKSRTQDPNWCWYTYWDNTATYRVTEDSCSRYNVLDSLKINH